MVTTSGLGAALDANRRLVDAERARVKRPLVRQCLHTAAALQQVVVGYPRREHTLDSRAMRGLSHSPG